MRQGDWHACISVVLPLTGVAAEDGTRRNCLLAQTGITCQIIEVPWHGEHEAAWLIGLRQARGAWIGMAMPGTVWLPDKLSRQFQYLVICQSLHAGTWADVDSEDPPSAPFPPEQALRRLYLERTVHPTTILLPTTAARRAASAGAACPLSACLHHLASGMPVLGLSRIVAVAQPPRSLTSSNSWNTTRLRTLSSYVTKCAQLGISESTARAEALTALVADRAMGSALRLIASTPRTLRTPGHASQLTVAGLRGLYRWLPLRLRLLTRRRPSSGPTAAASAGLNFADIWQNNGFGGTESLSGAGSTLFQTRIVRRELPRLLRRIGIRTILDIPCGDFHWMRHVNLHGVKYIGADIVPGLIADNQTHHGSASRSFTVADLIAGPLPQADLVLTRDCLVHLPLAQGIQALDTIRRSGARWLLATTFTDRAYNPDLDASAWRPLNLTQAPFFLPPPLCTIVEGCSEGGGLFTDKALGLWSISDIAS